MFTLNLNHFLDGNSKLKRSLLLPKMILIVLLLLSPSQLAQGKFLGNVIGSSIPENFSNYWDQVTPENAGKWGSVESNRDSMNWSSLDQAYDYAKSRGYPYKHHTLVWGSQQPGWISGLSQDEQRAEVEEWIQAVGQRYPNMDFIDVVNEPLHDPPPYKDALGGDGSTGWDWVIWVFEKARQYCNGQLILNDYGIVNDGNAATNYITIINLLKDRGLIDAIGVQAHCFNVEAYDVSTLQSNLDRLAQTGLPIYVAEFELRGDDSTQLQRYQEKFPVFWEHSGVYGVTLWGYIQGVIWQSEAWLVSSGSVGSTERPAMQWLMDYVGGGTTTTTSATTSTTTTAATTSTTTTSGGGCDCGTCDWYGTDVPTCCESCSGWGWYDGGCRRSCVCPSNCEGGCVGGQCGSTTTTTTAATTTSTTTTSATTSTTTTAVTTSTTTTAATTSTTTTAATTSTTTTAATTTTTAATTTTTAAAGCTCDSGCDGTAISPNFSQNGSGQYCWQATSGNYINSWNVAKLEVNDTDYTNKFVFTSSFPAKINGVWYIYYNSSVPWGHFELNN